jgi:DNA polymerase
MAGRGDRAAALEAIAAEVRAHRGCGVPLCEAAARLVPGEGDPEADVVIVGEAPGASEEKAGRPFVGSAGKLLDRLLAEAGLAREDVYITNVVKARPPGNRDPTAAEVAHHLPWLERELEVIEPTLLVPLGRHALSHFAPDLKISQVHGTAIERGGRRLFPMYHPAAALHRPPLRESLFADAQALGALLNTPQGVPTLES